MFHNKEQKIQLCEEKKLSQIKERHMKKNTNKNENEKYIDTFLSTSMLSSLKLS